MKHLVMVKWNDSVKDRAALENEVLALFKKAEALPEIRGVELVRNAVDLPNRYHAIFIITLDKEDIGVWNGCEPHKIWKKDYPQFLEAKAIFDWE